MTTTPPPQRLSDADRDSASGCLRAHYEAGRLNSSEFEERLGVALAARTTDDLKPLFHDLPAPHPECLGGTPAPSMVATPTPQGSYAAPVTWERHEMSEAEQGPKGKLEMTADIVCAVVWPVAIVAMIFGDAGWWPIAAAIVLSATFGAIAQQQRQQRQARGRLPGSPDEPPSLGA